jgi:hypothetical protein
MQLGYTGEAEWCPKQAAEETRGPPAADRARTQGGGLGVCVLHWHFGGLRVLLQISAAVVHLVPTEAAVRKLANIYMTTPHTCQPAAHIN